MIALTQCIIRVSAIIEGEMTSEIGAGLLALLGAERDDDEQETNRLRECVFGYRAFSNAEGGVNLNVRQAGDSVLVVPQFTLTIDTEWGVRSSLPRDVSPDRMEALYDYLVERYRQQEMNMQTGRFIMGMQVPLVGDDPMILWLQV